MVREGKNSGKKKEHKPKLLGPDIFQWGGGLPLEGVGPKSSVRASKPGKSNFLGGTSRDFAGISRRCPKSLEKKQSVFDSWPLKSELFKARPVQFGALPAAAGQLLTKPRSRPKIEPNFEALSWFFLEEKPQNSYEPGGLVNSLVSGTPKIK